MLGADLVPPCHLRNNCARGKGFRNDPALLRLGPATPTPNTCPDFYSAARPRSVKYIVNHICEPIPSNRSTSADLSKPPQGAVRRPLTLDRGHDGRNLSPATQRSYLSAVSKFSRYFGRSPDRLHLEDVRAFQVYLVATGISWPALNRYGTATFAGLTSETSKSVRFAAALNQPIDAIADR